MSDVCKHERDLDLVVGLWALVVNALFWVSLWENVCECLVGVGKILLNCDGILDLKEDDWSGAKEGEEEETPVGGEFSRVGDFAGVERPHDSGTGRLNTLVETDIVGRTTTRVGESTHVPILC